MAWLIPPAGQEIEIIDLGDAQEIETNVRLARQILTDAPTARGAIPTEGESAAAAKYDAQLQTLTKLVWQPLANRLPEGAKKLIISPDSDLWLLPWSALPLGEDKYLVEDYELKFVTSGRQLLNVAVAEAKLATTPPVLFADPDFDLTSEAARKATLAIFPNFKMNDELRAFSAHSALPRAGRLPGTKLEAAAISPLVERMVGRTPTTYADRYALESVVKRVARPKMLVLSTHGFFNSPVEEPIPKGATMDVLIAAESKKYQNPLLRCGLLLAGCNQQQTATDDGVLTGLEIVGLDLRGTELVVLSACETAVGRVFYGEGVAGLRQAFQLAGAKSVVATLWQVPDRESAVLMVVFFAGLAEGKSSPEALRAAQLQRIMAHRKNFGVAHPYYWGAWTVTQN